MIVNLFYFFVATIDQSSIIVPQSIKKVQQEKNSNTKYPTQSLTLNPFLVQLYRKTEINFVVLDFVELVCVNSNLSTFCV